MALSVKWLLLIRADSLPCQIYTHSCRFRGMTLTEAAKDLGVAPATLRHQIRNRRLQATKVGRDWVVSDEEIHRYAAISRGKPGRRSADQLTLGLLDANVRQES
jgi:excisionase family DNA binding protein